MKSTHKDLPAGSQAWAADVDALLEENKQLREVVKQLAANAGIDFSNPRRGINTGDTPSVKNPVQQKLASLADTDTYDVADGQVLTWSQKGQRWLPVTPTGGAAVPIPEEIAYYNDAEGFMGLGEWADSATNNWAFSGYSNDGTWQAQGTHAVNLLAGRWDANDGTLMSFEMTEQANGQAEINLILEDYDANTQIDFQMLRDRFQFHGAPLVLPVTTTASRPTHLDNVQSDIGAVLFDSDLRIPIVWSGTAWTNFIGTAV